jgi:uncharacterized protein YecT (DUF1311 family)
MTDKEWQEEVARVVASAGAPWVVRAAWIERRSEACAAELVDNRSGKEQTIRVSTQQYATAPERRAEILRLLQTGRANR